MRMMIESWRSPLSSQIFSTLSISTGKYYNACDLETDVHDSNDHTHPLGFSHCKTYYMTVNGE